MGDTPDREVLGTTLFVKLSLRLVEVEDKAPVSTEIFRRRLTAVYNSRVQAARKPAVKGAWLSNRLRASGWHASGTEACATIIPKLCCNSHRAFFPLRRGNSAWLIRIVADKFVGGMCKKNITGRNANDVFVLTPKERPVFLVFGEIRFEDQYPGHDATCNK